MKKSVMYVLSVLVLTMAFMPVVNAQEKKEKAKPIKVTGELMQQDEEDEKSPLVITNAETEKTYILKTNKKTAGLKDLVGKIVTVTGVPGTDKSGAATLMVMEFVEVKAAEDDEDGGVIIEIE